MSLPADRPRRVVIETLGCKLNQADSALLADRFADAGITPSDDVRHADVLVLNTCTVTHVADRKARKRLRAMRRANPEALLVATGCYAERAAAEVQSATGADLVLGNRDKRALVDHVLARAEWGGSDAAAWTRTLPIARSTAHDRLRAFIRIQAGCRYACAFCIVPRVRGTARSEPADEVLDVVRRRLDEGYRELVLTGTEVGDYGLLDGSLVHLVRAILAEPGLQRLRISSLQPQELTPDLLSLWDDPRLCPHFHVALQSGSPAILAAMRRPYTREQLLDAITRIRAAVPKAGITTDVIAGFPGETEADFQATLDLCRQVGFSAIHAFPYSKRSGTSAARLPGQVLEPIVAERMQRLLALATELEHTAARAAVGSAQSVLWETTEMINGAGWVSGLTGSYLRARAPAIGRQPGLIETVPLIAADQATVIAGEPAP